MMKLVKRILAVLGVILVWVLVAGFGALNGWWMNPLVPEGNHQAFYASVVRMIEDQNAGNSAFVLIENGEVVAEYFGTSDNRVDRHTAFPTASFSKWITAMSVMSLVEAGKVDLDAPVSTYLTRWSLPESGFDNGQVTVRRLLSHTAGLVDRLGFGDYTADEKIPPIEESLRQPRATRGPGVEIVVGLEPGAEFLYSGGGYLILQLLVEEVSGQPFASFVRAGILEPLSMRRSSFEYVGMIDNFSRSFDRDGNLAPSYQYAAAGATGFVSTAADLTSMVQALTGGRQARLVLSAATATSMREPHGRVFGISIWGLGTILYSSTPGGDYVYGHDGVNEPAINVSVRVNPETRDGYIMLVNGHPSLASNAGSEWVLWQTGYPDFLSLERAVRSAVVPMVIGTLMIFLVFLLYFRRQKQHRDSASN